MNTKLKWGLGIFGGVILLGALAGGGDQPPPADAAAAAGDTAAPERAPVTPARQVSARELYAAFDANEVAAQREYGGAPLIITGEIERVTLDITDSPVVRLSVGPSALQAVSLSFDKAATDATAALAKGETVRARCAKLAEVMGTPMLSDCTLQ